MVLLNFTLAACAGQTATPSESQNVTASPTASDQLPPPSTPDPHRLSATVQEDLPTILPDSTPLDVPFVPPTATIAPTRTPAPSPGIIGNFAGIGNLPPLVGNPINGQVMVQLNGQGKDEKGKPEALLSSAISPDHKWLALSDRNIIWVVDLSNGKTLQTLLASSATGSDQGASSLSWSGDGTMLAAGGLSGVITLWRWDHSSNEFRKGPLRLSPSALSESFGDSIEVAFSPDSKYLAGFGSDGNITVYDASTGRGVYGFNSEFAGYISWSPDSKRLADEFLLLHYLDSGNSVDPSEDIGVGGDGPEGVAWSPDGKKIAVSGEAFEVLLVDAPTPQAPDQLNPSVTARPLRVALRNRNGDNAPTTMPHLKEGRRVAWSPDSRMVAVANVPETGKISLWDSTGQPLLTLDAGTDTIRTLLWPQNNLMISAGNDGVARLWQLTGPAPSTTPTP